MKQGMENPDIDLQDAKRQPNICEYNLFSVYNFRFQGRYL